MLEKNVIGPAALALALALVLALGALAGCGGSSEAGGASISQEQFKKEGDKICREVFSKISRRYNKLSGFVAARDIPGSASERQMNKGTQKFIVPAITELVHRLRAIGAPAEQAHPFAKTIAALEAGIRQAEKDPRAARGSLGVEYAFQNGFEMLQALGLGACK